MKPMPDGITDRMGDPAAPWNAEVMTEEERQLLWQERYNKGYAEAYDDPEVMIDAVAAIRDASSLLKADPAEFARRVAENLDLFSKEVAQVMADHEYGGNG